MTFRLIRDDVQLEQGNGQVRQDMIIRVMACGTDQGNSPSEIGVGGTLPTHNPFQPSNSSHS